MSEASDRVDTFGWQECRERLEELLSQRVMRVSRSGDRFVATEEVDGRPIVEFFVPPCLPLPSTVQDPRDYLDQLSDSLGEQLVILLQAGAAALGWWDHEDVVYQKVIKTYAVRGRGRAQILHAKTKGKSRYGSRLRLRLAQQHLVDINEKINDWWDENGPPDRIFYSCPQRMWPELFSARPAPRFDQRDERLAKIPIHVHIPNEEELHRVRGRLSRGRIVTRNEGVG